MTVGAHSYGTASDVAALTWAWVAEEPTRTYTTETLPTMAQVEAWIDQVSAVMNMALSKNGFDIPVAQADAVLAIKNVVVGYVAEMANYANSTGRFFTERALASGVSPFELIRKEINDWVESFALGLELAGAGMITSDFGQIGYREADDAGDPVPAVVQRRAFGNIFQDWTNE